MKQKELPNTLHELLSLAIKDLEIAKKRKNVELNMTTYMLKEISNNKCYVCMAGAIMLYTLCIRPTKYQLRNWNQVSNENKEKLFAIDSIRKGRYWEAFWYIYKKGAREQRQVLKQCEDNYVNNDSIFGYNDMHDEDLYLIARRPQDFVPMFKKHAQILKEAGI